jgi:hypothetical protein
MPYIAFGTTSGVSRRFTAQRGCEPTELQGNTAMTIEILNLTAQIQRWLNARVAHYLAEQAHRLPH